MLLVGEVDGFIFGDGVKCWGDICLEVVNRGWLVVYVNYWGLIVIVLYL